MKTNNPFEQHGITYISPSSMNLFVRNRPLWIMSYLFLVKDGSGAGAIRGIVSEEVLAKKFETHIYDYTLLRDRFFEECNKYQIDTEDTRTLRELASLERYGEVIDFNFDYEDLQGYQEKVKLEFQDIPVPIIGYIDFRFKDKVVDLKTTARMPSKPPESVLRQMAVYSLAYPEHDIDLFYASPRQHKIFSLQKETLEIYKKQMIKIAFIMQNFLASKDTKEELAQSEFPDFERFDWSETMKNEAKKIWS
jgi:hypothetical protein